MNQTTFSVNKQNLEVVIERVFNAPKELIWKVISDPNMIPKWWGPAQFETVVEKMDFRVGGQWRFIHKNGTQEYAFHGVYKEIVPLEKVTDTFNFEPIGPGHEMVETMTLADLGDGTTKVTTVSKFQNIADLEGMVGSDMESGARQTWERLAKLVEHQ